MLHIIREMQMKTLKRYVLTLTETANIKKMESNKAC